MSGGEHDVLDRIELATIPADEYWHVYPAAYLATASNPKSKARLAWCDGAHGMYYAGDTPAAALWETALRFATVTNGRVYADQSSLRGMVLARLTLTIDVPAIDLRPPYRRSVVDAHSDLDSMWDDVLKTPRHEETHPVTSRLMHQVVSRGYSPGTALRWHSRQAGADSVILFFEPPMSSAWWSHSPSDAYRLDDSAGEKQIEIALSAQNLAWIGSPTGGGFELPHIDDPLFAQQPVGREAK